MENTTKVITGKVRFSYANVWEAKSVNGGDEKYSVSLIIPKSDKKTIADIKAAIEQAKKEGLSKFGGKAPANLKLPLRDGDVDRPDDEAYNDCYFVNANSKDRPGIVDKNVKPILDQSEVYSGCYGRASINHHDVEVERQVRNMLSRFPVPENEWRLWTLDQRINDRGVLVDSKLVDHAIHCDEQHKAKATEEAILLTGLDNPSSVYQLKNWLYVKEGIQAEKLTKDTVPELVKQTGSKTVKRVLELRRELAKTSVRKYTAMKNALCFDGKVRGLLQFYGARTGRWAGRIFQPQNLPRISLSNLDLTTARNLLKSGEYEMLDALYRSTPDVLSQLIRTVLIASEGQIFHVVDFNSIEALLLAYYAEENWALDVFYAGGDIYAYTASRMYDKPVSTITKESPERARGKVGCLACGYQGGIGAIQKFVKPGEMSEDEMREIVHGWRDANPNIVKFWKQFNESVTEAIAARTTVKVTNGISFEFSNGMLFMHLPSRRRLSYPKVKIEPHPVHGRDAISFEGINSVTKKWGKQFTYSGKLVENAIQAIARDCLAVAMERSEEAGYPILLTVHDELITLTAETFGSADNLAEIVTQPIAWAPGLKLRASGDSTDYYCK